MDWKFSAEGWLQNKYWSVVVSDSMSVRFYKVLSREEEEDEYARTRSIGGGTGQWSYAYFCRKWVTQVVCVYCEEFRCPCQNARVR